jgi:hypothetical protein
MGALAACLVFVRTAEAETTPGSKELRADTLFRQGTHELDAGQVEAACSDLRESLHLDPELGTLLNLALCHEKSGDRAAARAEYLAASAWAAESNQPERRDFARQHANDLERELSRVLLDLPDVKGLAIDVDARPVADPMSSLPLFLDAGPHVLSVRAPGKEALVLHVTVLASQPGRTGAPAQIVAVPALEDATERPEDSSLGSPVVAPLQGWGTRQNAGLGLTVAGVVAVAVGTYYGVHVLTTSADVKPPEAASLVSLGLGAAAIGSGVWLWFGRPTRSVTTARLVPSVDAHGGELRVIGTW